MQIVAHGVDLVQCSRIGAIWKRHGAHFLDRVFTPAEQDYCLDGKHAETRLAGRFAAKEAVLKALGTGWRGGIEWTDIETLPDPLGKPVTTLRGESLQVAGRIGVTHVLVSISHAGEYAVASAVAVRDA